MVARRFTQKPSGAANQDLETGTVESCQGYPGTQRTNHPAMRGERPMNVFHDLTTLDIEALAPIIKKTPQTIAVDLSRAPHTLPPPVRIPGSARVFWRAGVVAAWLEKHQAPEAERPVPRRRGRPRKSSASK